MATATASATVVIPTYNARALLDQTLSSLERQTADFATVVVDNASDDGTNELVRQRYPWVEYLRLDRNHGFGKAVNKAALVVETEALVLLNNDVVCEPDFVEQIVAPLTDPSVGMVAGVLRQARAPGLIDVAGIELDRVLGGWECLWNQPLSALAGDVRDPDGPCAGAAAYRASAFKQVGGFDETFFAYLEDVELAIQLRLAGYRCVLAPRAQGDHLKSATLGAGSRRQLELHHFGRGYIIAKYRLDRSLRGRLSTFVLEWPFLGRDLLRSRNLSLVRARRQGLKAGRRCRSPHRAPTQLATVSVREALRRQWRLIRLRKAGQLPTYFSIESSGAEESDALRR